MLVSEQNISMVYCNTEVSQLLKHWRYCSLALNHQYREKESAVTAKLLENMTDIAFQITFLARIFNMKPPLKFVEG